MILMLFLVVSFFRNLSLYCHTVERHHFCLTMHDNFDMLRLVDLTINVFPCSTHFNRREFSYFARHKGKTFVDGNLVLLFKLLSHLVMASHFCFTLIFIALFHQLTMRKLFVCHGWLNDYWRW